MAPPTTKVRVTTTASSSRLPQSTTTTIPIPIATATAPRYSQPIPPNTNPDLRPFFSRLTATLRHSFAQRRPWSEIIDRSTLRCPETFSEVASRLRKNLSYFRINYTAIIAVVAILSLLSHPFPLFFLISLMAAWLYLYLFRPADQPVLIYDRVYSDREILGILIISTIMIVFLTGLGSLLISSVIFGFGITCVHGAFRVPQEVFVDDQEPMTTALFSFLMGTAAAVGAVATPPTTVTRV